MEVASIQLARKKDVRSLILFTLWIAVASGFSTHLLIKMRPYNSTPSLGYKVIFSIFAFTMLFSYFIDTSRKLFKNQRNWHVLLIGVWLLALLSALTRPAAINSSLNLTGLVGYSDPATQLISYLK